MQRALAAGSRGRVFAVVPTLVVHGLFLVLLLQEEKAQRREGIRVQPRAVVGIWIQLPVTAGPANERQNASESHRASVAPISLMVPQVRPSTGTQSVDPAPPESTERAPAVDWYGEAGRLAARAAAAPDAPRSFSEPAKALREPCKPRDSSFQWNPQEERRGLLPLPYMMIGERCVIGLGFFGCALNALPDPEKELFDDMKGELTPESSVPGVDACD